MWRMCPIECDKVPHTGLILPWQKLLRYGIKDTPKQLNHSTKIKVLLLRKNEMTSDTEKACHQTTKT